jgi:hypothetical protein
MLGIASITVALLALGAGTPARAQLLHRGTSGFESLSQTVQFLDTWEQGGTALARSPRDIVTRLERTSPTSRSTSIDLLLFGPWGAHLYRFDELKATRDIPLHSFKRTTWRAIDLDDDGRRELVLIERIATARVALTELGEPADQPGPFFDELTVAVRWLQREGDTLLEHDLEGNPDEPALAAILAHELGGPTNMALQLLAGDWHFKHEQFEKARYRYRVAREWAEGELPGREVAKLSPVMPLETEDPDSAAITWIQAVRRIGSLPPWFQKH